MPPAYSTDFAALPEMLAWLNGIVWLGGIFLNSRPRRLPTPEKWSAFAMELPAGAFARGERTEEGRWRFEADGDTLPEAVARLVVKVAEKAAWPEVSRVRIGWRKEKQ